MKNYIFLEKKTSKMEKIMIFTKHLKSEKFDFWDLLKFPDFTTLRLSLILAHFPPHHPGLRLAKKNEKLIFIIFFGIKKW